MNTNCRAHQIIRWSLQRSERNITELLTLLCLITLIVVISASAQAQGSPALQKEDTQQWNDLQITVGISKQVDFNFYSSFRFGRDITHLVDRRTGAGFTFRTGKYLTFTPNYLNIVMRPSAGRKVNENRLTLPITVRVPVGKFLLSDRNQFERRLRFPLNSTRYRNRLQIERPIKIKQTSLQLFAFDEIFYDWSLDAWVRNRFGVGVSRKFNKYFTGDLYYMHQADGRSRPGDLHIIGATYRLRF
jgi:hypothetical protein